MSENQPTAGTRASDPRGAGTPQAPTAASSATTTPGATQRAPAAPAQAQETKKRFGKKNKAPKPQKPSKASKTPSKANDSGSDWGVFRAVVIIVGIIIAGLGVYFLLTGTHGLPDASQGPFDPTLESQFRFYAALQIGVGAAFVAIAIKFEWSNMLWLICMMVFLGGVGRVISWAMVGSTPHVLMILLMIVELAFPAALLVWHGWIAKTAALKQSLSNPETATR